MSIHDEYRAALKRLQTGQPLRVPVGTKITNDAVSLEAGRKKGSIKKGRHSFAQLIRDIEDAAQKSSEKTAGAGASGPSEQIDADAANESDKGDATDYKKLYYEALDREISLVYEVQNLKNKLAELERKPRPKLI
ncbi:hypothetical protein [Burkholderia pseudomallei]|uniref:hypothetical protein n=1 Tax=Burkholderia pseudomallei TaxID=28450 RepID=UPI0012AEDF91|nr:hypothetical protein [Burkholderia pseudomallei]